MHPWIKFKTINEKNEYPMIRDRLKIVLDDMAQYFQDHGYDFILTDLLEEQDENRRLRRVSKSHMQGRAADLRVRHLPKKFILQVIAHFSAKYKHWAAITSKTNLPCLIVYHDNGNGIHFHIQIKPYKEEVVL